MIFTEKFALLNLLKALEGLSAQNSDNKTQKNTSADADFQTPREPEKVPDAAEKIYPNVMASVLERHEVISNRVKNKK